MEAPRPGPISVEEYLRRETHSTVRHEYVGGLLYAMAGASERHVLICTNLVIELGLRARRTNCRVLANDMLVQAAADHFYYPDIVIVCDPADNAMLVKRNPGLIIEVLSPTIETVDKREKLFMYRQLPSLQTYLMVDRDARSVDRWWRDGDGAWRHTDLRESGAVPLGCLPGELTLDAIYAEVFERTTETTD
jgi:Uma2 family endonuclease